MWHHIIPKHEWKLRFGNLDGVDAQDNLVNLTAQQHAQVHRLLYELNGNEFDRICSEGLSGMIGHEEVIVAIQSLPKKEAHKRNIAPKLKGKRNALGVRRSAEQKASRSKFMLGNKNSIGRIWITNSFGENRCLPKGSKIPDGWKRGRNISFGR